MLPAVERVHSLRKLPDGWKDEGSHPLQQAAVKPALALLAALSEQMPNPPHIGPLADGGVQISWERRGHALEFFINGEGSVEYLTEHPTAGTTEQVLQVASSPIGEEVRPFIRSFLLGV